MIKFVRVSFHGVWRSWIWKFLELSTGYEWVCYLSVQGIILRVKISEKRRIQLLHLKKKKKKKIDLEVFTEQFANLIFSETKSLLKKLYSTLFTCFYR